MSTSLNITSFNLDSFQHFATCLLHCINYNTNLNLLYSIVPILLSHYVIEQSSQLQDGVPEIECAIFIHPNLPNYHNKTHCSGNLMTEKLCKDRYNVQYNIVNKYELVFKLRWNCFVQFYLYPREDQYRKDGLPAVFGLRIPYMYFDFGFRRNSFSYSLNQPNYITDNTFPITT